VSTREFLGQGWMKLDKLERTPYIMKTSQHFNDVRFKTDLYSIALYQTALQI
jgi:hypothetical protein